MSCQQGRPQGRLAGHNAILHLLGTQYMQEYYQPNYMTCVDLENYSDLYTKDEKEKLKNWQEACELQFIALLMSLIQS